MNATDLYPLRTGYIRGVALGREAGKKVKKVSKIIYSQRLKTKSH